MKVDGSQDQVTADAVADTATDSAPETWLACRVALDDEYNPCGATTAEQAMKYQGSVFGAGGVCSSIFFTYQDPLLGWTCTYRAADELVAWARVERTPRCGGAARAVFASLYSRGQLEQACLEVDSWSWTWQLGFDPGPPTVSMRLGTMRLGPTATLAPAVNLVAGGSEFAASDLSFRYWYTADAMAGVSPQQAASCDGGFVLDCATAKVSLASVTPPRATADSYLEVSFPMQNWPVPTGTSIGLLLSISRADGALYDQSNDYSYNGEVAGDGVPTAKVTAYLKGALIAGTEP